VSRHIVTVQKNQRIPEGSSPADEGASLFRSEPTFEYHHRLHGDVIVILPPALRTVAALLTTIVIALAAFLVWGQYARKETVTGYLSPGSGVVKVYSPQTGLVGEVFVGDGAYVERGNPLFSIDTMRYAASADKDVEGMILASLKAQRDEIDIQLNKAEELRSIQAPYHTDGISLLNEEIGALSAQLLTQKNMVALAGQDLTAVRQLERKGYVSAKANREVKERFLLHQQQLHALEEQLADRRNGLLGREMEAQQSPIELSNQISQLRKERAEIDQHLLTISSQRTAIVRAPVSGRVSFLQISPGKAVTSDIPTLTVVPDGSALVAELYVPSRAIGFVKAGQDVKLLYDALPFQQFGSYSGRIVSVSTTVLVSEEIPFTIANKEPVYRVIVKLAQQHAIAYGKPIALHPGMALKADIIFDKRALYEWALEPLYAVRGRML
jgi:membrane fusion protein